MLDCVAKFCAEYPKSSLREIRLTNFDRETVEILVVEYNHKFPKEEPKKKESNDDNW